MPARQRNRALRSIFALTVNLFLLLGFFTNAAASAEGHAALLDVADAEVTAHFETLQKIVDIESGSADTKGLLAVADVLDRHLTSLGFTTQRHPSTTGAKADPVVGIKNGNGKKRLLLSAHMDKGTLLRASWMIRKLFRLGGLSPDYRR